MGNINIEISKDLHQKLKLRAINLDKTLKDHIIDILDVGLKK